MATQTKTCPKCAYQNSSFDNNCRNCGSAFWQSPPPDYGGMQPMRPPGTRLPGADKKVSAGICAILLGGFGIHKFILGYTNEGVIMLVASIAGVFLTCGIANIVIGVIALIEGITYLTKSDEEFVQTYIIGRKPWF